MASTPERNGEADHAVLVMEALMRAFSVTEVLLGDMGVHPLGDLSRVRFSLTADEEVVSWQEQPVHAHDLFSRSERVSHARNHWSVPFGTICNLLLLIPR